MVGDRDLSRAKNRMQQREVRPNASGQVLDRGKFKGSGRVRILVIDLNISIRDKGLIIRIGTDYHRLLIFFRTRTRGYPGKVNGLG